MIEDGRELVGFGACGRQRDGTLAAAGFGGEIMAIYLRRSQQRRGGGRAIIAALARALTTADHHGAALWVLRENTDARAFYDNLGGLIIGEKSEDHTGFTLTEIAYGWADLAVLTG